MINSGLDIAEQEELNRISASLTLDKSTKAFAYNFLCEYKQKTRVETADKLSIIVCCAILAASKSQIITTVKGEKIRGIGISITQILRTLNNIPDIGLNNSEFLIVLKEFISTITLESEVLLELKQIIDRFAFTYTFYTKYKNIFKQLEIKESEEYNNLLQNLGWLIFINARAHILQNRTELVEAVYLLAATFTHILFYLPDSITVSHFQRNGIKIHEKENRKNEEEAIICAVAELLKIKFNAEDYSFHKNSLYKYLQILLQNEVLKSNENASSNFEGMFDQSAVLSNTRKLENYYQKRLMADELDERFYMKDRKANTPGKFTPFAKQGAANKLNLYGSQNHQLQGQQQQSQQIAQEKNDAEILKKAFHSHRVLNYEITENVTIKSNLSEIKFTNKSIPQSPYTRLMPATPMTAALEMYNWLSEKVRKLKKGYGFNNTLQEKCLTMNPPLDLEAMRIKMEKLSEQVLLIEKDMHDPNNLASQINLKKYKDYHTQAIALYVRVIEELLLQIDRKTVHGDLSEFIHERNFHQALTACCIETVFFINNSSNMNFLTLLEKCEIQAFDFWRVIAFFVKFDANMPFPIKKNLYDLEIKIITQLAWRKGSKIYLITKTYFQENTKKENLDVSTKQISKIQSADSTLDNNEPSRAQNIPKDSENNGLRLDLNQSQEFFFQRVLHHTAGEIYQLSELLKIPDRVSENIWVVMKYILSTEPDLLIDRHVTQLILCTVYGVCKMSNLSLKFQEIIAKYHELPTFNKSDLSEIIYNVYISDHEKGDLVRFYNVVYISQLKNFLFNAFGTKSVDIKSQTPQIKKPLIPALALASPLKDSLPQNMMNMALVNQKKSPMLKHRMTPTSNAPYVFSEFSGYGSEQSTNNNISSKRLINFEECNNSENISNISTENAIKVPKYNSSLMERIVEQKHEDIEDSNKKVPSRRNLFGSSIENDTNKELAQGQGASKVLNFDIGSTFKSENATKSSIFTGNMQKGGLLAKPSMNIQQQPQTTFTSKPKGVRLNFDDDESLLTKTHGSPSGIPSLLKNSEPEKGSKLLVIDRKEEGSLNH